MKYFVIFLVVCVALAAAAPQVAWGAWPGVGVVGPRTLVAGPTVLNGWNGWNGWNGYPGLAGRFIAPGVLGTTLY